MADWLIQGSMCQVGAAPGSSWNSPELELGSGDDGDDDHDDDDDQHRAERKKNSKIFLKLACVCVCAGVQMICLRGGSTELKAAEFGA
eukprot:CAMPEP_0171495512 /NCGR_PEP_ID=MMETSP0958-20121227/6184_1 /TAXON_ID=87120 /ORGANISM="Aurantiochytrium limacinum, Strain ATCCMYA-1381" /LENGTH=87 /DNA_ID=CAMNT_0012029505 /DNA_START=287 /DNA_END=551 /DNA_ORIENTATION=-